MGTWNLEEALYSKHTLSSVSYFREGEHIYYSNNDNNNNDVLWFDIY